jgi:molybdate transport system ATP-binding protein
MDAMDHEIAARSLYARVRKSYGAANSSAFELNAAIEVSPGITILFGPSGAGKSTLLDSIAGLVTPNAGKIVAGGESLFDYERAVNVPPQRRQIAYVFQSLALFPHMSVEANVAYGLADLGQQERRRRANEILTAFRIDGRSRQKPGEISGGEKQRVALARSLVTRPRVLLLDEPLTGLDAELKHALVDDLRAWNAANSIPILYVTHDREEVDALGERVIAMDHGRVIGEGTPLEVLDSPRRGPLAQAAGFENIQSGVVVDLGETDGVMRVRLDKSACEIEVPLGHAGVGSRVTIAIRAGDILLAVEKPAGLSARNILEGRILTMEQRGTMVVVGVDCGAIFTVHLTPGAVRTLRLASGLPVWLVLKTHSCHFVED